MPARSDLTSANCAGCACFGSRRKPNCGFLTAGGLDSLRLYAGVAGAHICRSAGTLGCRRHLPFCRCVRRNGDHCRHIRAYGDRPCFSVSDGDHLCPVFLVVVCAAFLCGLKALCWSLCLGRLAWNDANIRLLPHLRREVGSLPS